MPIDWKKHARTVLRSLGEDVTWTHAGTPATVTGVFTEPFREVQVGEIAIGGSMPHFSAAAEDLVGVAKGDTITRGAIVYTVRDVQADEPTGLTVLPLER